MVSVGLFLHGCTVLLVTLSVANRLDGTWVVVLFVWRGNVGVGDLYVKVVG